MTINPTYNRLSPIKNHGLLNTYVVRRGTIPKYLTKGLLIFMTLSTHLVTSEGRLFLFPFASSHFEETRQERLKTPTTIFRNINSPCHHQPLHEESPIFLKYHRKRPQTTLLTSGNNRVSLRESRSVTTPYSHTHTHTGICLQCY